MSSEHKKHSHQNRESSAFVGSVKSATSSKDMVKIIATVVVVVIVLAGGSYLWLRYRHNQDQTNQQNKDFATLLSNVNKFRSISEDNLAKQSLLDFNQKYAGKETQNQQYTIAGELAAIYSTENDTKNALIWQQKALDVSLKPSFSDYYSLGETYMIAGDKPNAIKYLKLALAALDTDKNIAAPEAHKKALTAQINQLEKP